MLSEKDLVFLGAVLIWSSPIFPGNVEEAVTRSQMIFDATFNQEVTNESNTHEKS